MTRMRSKLLAGVGSDSDASPSSSSSSSAGSSSYWWRHLPDYEALQPELFPVVPAPPRSAAAALSSPRLRAIRELERLALFANESLDEIRHKLLTYKAGDLWLPAGGIAKDETDIPPVITVLLVGFAGAGKTSLVDLMYSVLGRAGFIPFSQATSPAGKDGRTLCLEEHNVARTVRNGFCVFDSRGLDYDDVPGGLEEVAEWMETGVRHRQPCRGAGASSPPSSSSTSPSSSSSASKRFLRRRVNFPIVVASLSELHRALRSGDLRPLEATRELFHHPSIRTSCTDSPILLLSHGDELTPEERIDVRVKVCEYLGALESTEVYDVTCLNEYGAAVDEMDPVTSYAVVEAVYRALVVADRSHPPKPGVADSLLLALAWCLCALAALFAFLSASFSKFAKAASREHKLRLQ